jgi:hypothetical protein
MNDELEGMRKEAIVAILSRHFPGGTEKNHKKPVGKTGLRAELGA